MGTLKINKITLSTFSGFRQYTYDCEPKNKTILVQTSKTSSYLLKKDKLMIPISNFNIIKNETPCLDFEIWCFDHQITKAKQALIDAAKNRYHELEKGLIYLGKSIERININSEKLEPISNLFICNYCSEERNEDELNDSKIEKGLKICFYCLEEMLRCLICQDLLADKVRCGFCYEYQTCPECDPENNSLKCDCKLN